MGEVIEFEIISREFLNCKELLSLIRYRFSKQNIISKVKVMDDWTYKNVTENDISDMQFAVIKGKIGIIELIDIKQIGGIFVSKEDSIYFSYSIWFRSEYLPFLVFDSLIDGALTQAYSFCYMFVADLFKTFENVIEIIAIGMEMQFRYSDNVDTMLSNSHNVYIWVIKNRTCQQTERDKYITKIIAGIDAIIYERE